MYSRPTLSDLIQRIRDDLLSRVASDDVLRRADTEVYSRVLAGVANGLYGYIAWLSDQVIYDKAEQEYLDRWCSIWGKPRKAAKVAVGTAVLSVSSNGTVAEGTLLQADDGQRYQLAGDASVMVPTSVVQIQAVTPGAAGNRVAGQKLSLVSPVDGIQSTAVSGALSGGADAELDDDLRARLLARIQNPPQGGAASDYVSWAVAVPGVTRAWVYPGELGAGTVTLRFVCDHNPDGLIPNASTVAALQATLDALRPVTAQLSVVAPVAAPLNFTIQGLVPNTAAVSAAVQAELQDLLTREAVPGGTILLSHIRAAISAAAGESDYVLLSPSTNVTSPTGSMSTMGNITWL